MEIVVTGGVEGAGAASVRRLVALLGGTIEPVGGLLPGWVVRLPRRAVPVVDLGRLPLAPPAPGADGWAGEVPSVVFGGASN